MRTASFFLAMALLLASLACRAQYPSASGLGITAGPQASFWHSAAAIYRPVPGAVAGLYVPIGIGNRWEIQPELLLSMDGTARDIPDGPQRILRTFHAALPVNLKLFLGRTFNLQAGAWGGYLLHARMDGNEATSTISTLDMGVCAGIGIGTGSGVDLTLRYCNGLANTLKDDHALLPSSRMLVATVGKRLVQFRNTRSHGH